ncbi:hypothetical protein ACVWXR_000884 [Pseudomonas lurida]|uniref:Uncharacterized protein n=1 Tax=Pseudomonas fluorescens TaxID=294 RepID=A0A5E6VRY9_PSEFL|nr:hypothetical protein PS683_04373 [Pseudomonas fluorescens]VVN21112.1 hypothetical protein PS683_04373 [Pseudomonas fluorescens]
MTGARDKSFSDLALKYGQKMAELACLRSRSIRQHIGC